MDIQNFSALFNTPARREAFLKLIKDNKTKHIFIQGLEGSSIALFFSNLLDTSGTSNTGNPTPLPKY